MLAVALLAGCSKSSTVLIKEKPVVQRIGILPVNNPTALSSQSRSLLAGIIIPGWIAQLDNREKSKQFGAKMDQERLSLGNKLTLALIQELENEGFHAGIIDGVQRSSDDPERIDYAKIPTDDAVLHVWFDTVGMNSAVTSSDYIPRVNVKVHLIYPKDEDYLYSDTFYYGADSRGEKYWSIHENPKYKYASFVAMMEKPDDVAESFDVAVQAIARRLAGEFRKHFQ
jgi:hypothetical protein